MVKISEESMRDHLGWLIDVPMFIDRQRVDQLYDITVQPVFEEYRLDLTSESEGSLSADTVTHKAEVQGGVGFSGFGANLKGILGRESSETEEETDQRTYTVTQGSQRQLAQIAIQYLQATDEPESSSSSGGEFKKYDSLSGFREYATNRDRSGQRDLVVLQLPRSPAVYSDDDEDDSADADADENDSSEDEDGSLTSDTTLVPTAAEFENGSIVQIYELLESDREKPPRYPQPDFTWIEAGEYYEEKLEEARDDADEIRSDKIDNKASIARNWYWEWFQEKFDAKTAIEAIEDAAGEHGKVRWIDFRLPYSDDGKTLHLHIQGREEYNTGTFAYNLVKRGQKHGLTIIGTVKSEPDMDVLAIYER